jgi:hypothetical protein
MANYRDHWSADGGGRLRDRADAAAYLHVGVRTIDRPIDAGALKTVRLPVERARNGNGRLGRIRRIHIDVADLDLLIERNKETIQPVTRRPPSRKTSTTWTASGSPCIT